jgi:hypothetical protein
LETIHSNLETLADEANLSERLCSHLSKAKRLTQARMATVLFFWITIHSRVQNLNLAPAIEQAMLDGLIPALSLERVAERCSQAEKRQQLTTLSDQLLEPFRHPSHPIQALDLETQQSLEQVAGECADLFQRSSSCVEGRNGQLARHQRGHHRLSEHKQEVLTAIHHFGIQRSDGTTAAERLFAQDHQPLFEQVLKRMPWPARPARRRPRPKPQRPLCAVAA